MADDKDFRHGRDRDLVAGDQDNEVEYLAPKRSTTAQAREFIDRCGNDREVLEREVKKSRSVA